VAALPFISVRNVFNFFLAITAITSIDTKNVYLWPLVLVLATCSIPEATYTQTHCKMQVELGCMLSHFLDSL
jgi:hypothetical protein